MKKGFDYFIYFILFFVPLISILYVLDVLAMHYILGFIPYAATVIVIILLVLKKIKSIVKDYIIIMLLALAVISVPVSHIISVTNPFVFKYEEIDGGIELTSYDFSFVNDYEKEFILEIPAKINNKPVKSIGEFAFYNCQYFDELVIPEGVETIKKEAFTRSSFNKLILPQTLTRIESYAFDMVGRKEMPIDYIVLPNKLSYVGFLAFKYTAKKIFVPKSETKIYDEEKWDSNWYYGEDSTVTTSSGEISFIAYETIVHFNVKSIQIEDNVLYVLYDDNIASAAIIFDNTQIKILEELIINDEKYVVTSIETRAGFQCDFEVISIPRTIKIIEREAFAFNKKIKSIYIPNSVLYMEERVFTGCSDIVVNIEHKEIPSGWDKSWKAKNVTVNLNVSQN